MHELYTHMYSINQSEKSRAAVHMSQLDLSYGAAVGVREGCVQAEHYAWYRLRLAPTNSKDEKHFRD